MRFFYFLALSFLIISCGTLNKAYVSKTATHIPGKHDKKPIHTLYLIGDTGDTKPGEPNFVLPALQQMLHQEGSASSIVFLGDQLYPAGMPKKSSHGRTAAEAALNEQLAILTDYPGRAFFIPGERDWNNGRGMGLKAVLRQEEYLEDYFDEGKKVKMYPGQGCGDPKVLKAEDDLFFVFIDSQWWLQNWNSEKKINEGCDIKSRYDFITRMQEIFTEHKNDELVVFMHHPMRSNGIHGGRFGLKEHLLPFHESNNIPIPLPVLGSVVPIYRNIAGGRQDLANEQYQELTSELDAIARKVGIHAIFAGAHDNGLQHFSDYKLQYIVSGSGSRTNHIGRGGDASYAQSARGFCKVVFYEEFEAWLEIYTVAGPGQDAALAYRTMLRAPRPGTVEDPQDYPVVSKSDTILAANPNFAAGNGKKRFWGDQYRDIWTTPVKVPIIDLESELGGLTPIRKGGGMASNSLRMEIENGDQYALRSVNKDYRKLVPPDFRNLRLISVFQDQNSASHPYGALAVPALSRAADIYYTEPKLVYLQHQKALGNYNSQFPEELYLLEQRPSGDWSDAAQFGNAEEIISYNDLLAILREKKNHFVDQEWVCKSRMLDLLIHDWDRHDDQWRWAAFEQEDGATLYRPIPRDRDQVFYKFRGIFPSYIAAFFVKKFKTMKGDVKDVKNQSFNARYFDRYFLNQLEWTDWQAVITELQANVTDEAIAAAMNDFPIETRGPEDENLARLLRERRGNLMDIGRRLYDYISIEVEVTGSDNKDRFEVSNNDDGSLLVKVYVERDKKGDLLKYERTFYPSETKEVRLFGLRGKDDFLISGSGSNAITLRIIGGEDKDEVENTSNRKVFVYDAPNGIEMKGSQFRDKTSSDTEVNEYDRYGFQYNSGLPLLTLGYTKDDKIWVGTAISWTRHGWRKEPYKSKQSLAFSIAPGSRNAVQFTYEGHFPKLFKPLDFAPLVDFNSPRYENYFGLGNNSINQLREIEYNWVRIQTLELAPYLQLTNANQNARFKFGPVLEIQDLELSENRVSTDPMIGFGGEEAEHRQFLGARMDFETGFADSEVQPTKGWNLHAAFGFLKSLNTEEDVTNWGIDMQAYMTLLTKPQIVLANNVGFQKVYGEPQFYQYPNLGGRTNLRGYRNNRFRGDAAFFHNIDLRIRLIQSKNNLLPVDIGILGGYDYGRVWLDDEESEQWHGSQTVGLWFNLLGFAVLQPYYSFNPEENQFSFLLGFNF